jgi:DNA-binding response OmpR family regulator
MRVKDMLPKGNFDVVEAKDGVDGISKIHSEQPNLIMLDFLLPRKSGWEVYQEIQSDHNLKVIPLVLMSGRKNEVTEKISEPFEYFSFIEKPFDQKQLVAAIKDAMIKSKKHPAAPVMQTIPPADTTSMVQEIVDLNNRLSSMEEEMSTLKKQVSQLIKFIKTKL